MSASDTSSINNRLSICIWVVQCNVICNSTLKKQRILWHNTNLAAKRTQINLRNIVRVNKNFPL